MQSSECISLLRCTRDIKPYLWGLNVVDAALRSAIQSLWARVGTETSLMLTRRSIRNFNFPPLWKLNSEKLALQIPTPKTKIMLKCLKLIFFWKRKTRRSWLFTHLLSSKTLDLAELYFFSPLERLDISGSNSPPKPHKVQISHSPETDDNKISEGGCWIDRCVIF